MKKQVVSHENLIQICMLGAVLAFTSSAYANQSWDLAGDWNPPGNPSGAWTYGDYDGGSFVNLTYSPDLTSNPVSGLGVSGVGGYLPVGGEQADGFIFLNLTGSALYGIAPGQVSLESDWGTAVARWTAPTSGVYNITLLIGGTTAQEAGTSANPPGYGNNFAQYAGLNINMVGQTADSFTNNVMNWTVSNMWLSAGTTVDASVTNPGYADGGNTQTIFHIDYGALMVTGQVFCVCDSNAIANATVTLGTNVTTTDAYGAYVFTNVQPGTYDESAASSSYLGLTNSVTLNETVTNNFYLTNTTFLINPILDASITSLANADAISNAITSAVQVYSQKITDAMCVKIEFFPSAPASGRV
jgi:hypothetical protein